MNIQVADSKRDIQWINTMKTICLFLVFLFHSEFYCGARFFNFSSYYVRFYVSAFFFISGYLLFNKQLFSDLINLTVSEWWTQKGGGRTIISNGIWRIVIPTIIFCTLIYFPKSILRGAEMSLYDYVIDSILGKSSWFTWALFWAEVLMVLALLTRIKSIWFYFIFGIMMIVLEYIIKSNNIIFFNDEAMPWNYRQGLLACVFLAYGGVYRAYEQNLNKFFLSRMGFFVLLIMSAIYIYLVYYRIDSTVIQYCLSCLSILILVYFCKMFNGNNITKYIGRHSIGFFFVCGGLPNVFSVLITKYVPLSLGAMLPLVVAILSFFFAFFIVYALNEYLPFLFDLRILWNKK